MKFLELYYKLPIVFQNILISLYGLYWKNHRYGGVFNKALKEAKEREFYSFKQWEEYQTLELRKLLLHAYDTVPFYKDKYSKEGITRGFLSSIILSAKSKFFLV